MRMQDIDMRWIFVIVVVVLLLLSREPIFDGPLGIVLALIAGGYLCSIGWERLRRTAAPLRSTKTTYWRGQKLELRQDRRLSVSSWQELAPGVYYLVMGVAVVALALLGIPYIRL
jgi:hypothetical protein